MRKSRATAKPKVGSSWEREAERMGGTAAAAVIGLEVSPDKEFQFRRQALQTFEEPPLTLDDARLLRQAQKACVVKHPRREARKAEGSEDGRRNRLEGTQVRLPRPLGAAAWRVTGFAVRKSRATAKPKVGSS